MSSASLPLELLQASIVTSYLFYAGIMATAVATYTYMYQLQWVILFVARYFPYLLSGLENKKITVDEMTISYLERNPPSSSTESEEQETVVILHGYTACKEAMASVAVALPRAWRLIIVDLPAHGESLHVSGADYKQEAFVDKIYKFTQAIGLERFHLVGESMGAHISLLLTAKYEDKIKTLTAMCPPVDEAKRSKFFLTLETTGRNLILADNVTEFQQMLALVQHVPPKIMPQRVLKAMVDIQKERKKGYEDVFLQLMLSRESPEMYYEKLSHLRLPVFLIWGEDDRVCDISGGRILTKIISHAEMKVVERCGHALSIERPRKTSHLINAFIQKHVQ